MKTNRLLSAQPMVSGDGKLGEPGKAGSLTLQTAVVIPAFATLAIIPSHTAHFQNLEAVTEGAQPSSLGATSMRPMEGF